MEEKQLTELESLNIIQQMIRVAKEERQESGAGWLIWGWLLFLASISSAILSFLNLGIYISWVWSSILVAGLIIYIVSHVLPNRRIPVKTYVQELLDRIGTGFFISLFVIVFASYLGGGAFGFGYYYILYAFWMFIYGSVLRFQPLIIGAIVNWIAAIAIFLIQDFMYDMVVSSVAVLIGYLIPGYKLRAEYRKKMKP